MVAYALTMITFNFMPSQDSVVQKLLGYRLASSYVNYEKCDKITQDARAMEFEHFNEQWDKLLSGDIQEFTHWASICVDSEMARFLLANNPYVPAKGKSKK